ncbi:MAG: hypothetical protein S0880_26515, partial [Actinomycetota bacterium]|nr:hypothetical protein [Actinomycetota bacterium]
MDDSPSTAAHVRRPALVGAALVLVLDAAIAVPPPWTIAVAPVAFAGAAGRGVEPEVRAVAFAAGIVALFAAVPLGLP